MMKYAVSGISDRKLIKKLYEHGIYIINIKNNELLADPCSTHADMQCCNDMNGTLFFASNIKFSEDVRNYTDNNIIYTDDKLGKTYPDDIKLNILITDRHVYAHKNASGQILEKLKKDGRDIVYVNQGYCACSTLSVTENRFITADKSLYEATAADPHNEVLMTAPGKIILPGYGNGFIGGASCVTENEVLFFGDINSHPDAKRITDFINAAGKKAVSLCSGYLFDAGGAVFI